MIRWVDGRRFFVSVMLLCACGDPEAPPAAPSTAATAPELPAPSEPAVPTPPPAPTPTGSPVPEPRGPSCDMRQGLGWCSEYPEGHRAATPRERCATELGTWSDAPCARDGMMGLCLIDSGLDAGAVRIAYAYLDSTHASHAQLCRVAGGRYGPLVGPGSVDIAPAPPRFEMTPPSTWRPSAPWLATQGAENVAFFRGPAGADGMQPSLSVERVALAPGTTIESHAADFERSIAAEQDTTVTTSRRIDLDGTPAVVVEARVQDPFHVRMDLGGMAAMRTSAAYDVMRVAVVRGDTAWSVVCSGTVAARRAWARDCERTIESIRVHAD